MSFNLFCKILCIADPSTARPDKVVKELQQPSEYAFIYGIIFLLMKRFLFNSNFFKLLVFSD